MQDNLREQDGIEIYAEFSNSDMEKLQSGEYDLEVPEGTVVGHVNGTRRFVFTCVNSDIAGLVKDALDEDGINWQE